MKSFIMKTDKHLRGTQNDKDSAPRKLKKHNVNIRNRPLLHFQIGLVLSLIAVYAFIEIEVPITEVQVTPPSIEETFEEPLLAEVIPEKKKVVIPIVEEPRIVEPKKTPIPNIIKIIDDGDRKEEDSDDIPNNDGPSTFNPNDVETGEPDDYIIEIPMSFVQEAPIYPGCEGLSNQERVACMSKN